MREFLTQIASWPSTPEFVSSHDFRNFMELLDMSHPNHPFIYAHLYREFILPTNPGDLCVLPNPNWDALSQNALKDPAEL